jgi:hypothetical protein
LAEQKTPDECIGVYVPGTHDLISLADFKRRYGDKVPEYPNVADNSTRADGSTGAESSVPTGDPFPLSATNRLAPNGRDSGHTSPVRASAQETAQRDERQQLADDIIAWQSGDFGEDVTLTHVLEWHMRRMADILAAEARGRQQAEQARENRMSKPSLEQSLEDAREQRDVLFTKLRAEEKRSAALTQALKDYGHHKRDCAVHKQRNYKVACTCGYVAALTGAQK